MRLFRELVNGVLNRTVSTYIKKQLSHFSVLVSILWYYLHLHVNINVKDRGRASLNCKLNCLEMTTLTATKLTVFL